ncbi:MAG: hypothetical protein DME76_04525 [Verrucomicrobia bacterium]|nr:MAG: hypothetical protein DME76_04525 [Verrucomicrobiota bacterium]
MRLFSWQEPLLPRPFSLPNELWQLPQASLVWRVKSSGQGRWRLLAFEAHFATMTKGVVADYRFVGELRSLPVDL